jgi:septal ring factor EnvC (AmiA/AmiB activator)
MENSEPVIIPPVQQPEKNRVDEQLEAINTNMQKLQTSIASLRTDFDKLRSQVVPKAIMGEVENKINTHTKTLDGIQRKMHELNCQITAFAQQPISNTLLDSLRTQLTQETMESVKKLVTSEITDVKSLIDDKVKELQTIIGNAKRVMLHR